MAEILQKSDSGGFEGYASVFYKLDRHGHVVIPGAFVKSLQKFLNEGFIGGIGHDYGKPIGKYTKAYEDQRWLYVVADLSDVPEAKTVRTLLKDGVLTKLSIGYEQIETEKISMNHLKGMWEKAGYTPNEDDQFRMKQFGRDGVVLIKEANLLEVSPVSIPSNDDARILAYKSLDDTPAFTDFIHKARSVAYKLATVATKEGRVLSGRTENKLRAMAEVLASVSSEIDALLLLVQRQPEMEEDTDESVEMPPGQSATETAKILEAEERAKSMHADETDEPDESEKMNRKKNALARIRIIQITQGV